MCRVAPCTQYIFILFHPLSPSLPLPPSLDPLPVWKRSASLCFLLSSTLLFVSIWVSRIRDSIFHHALFYHLDFSWIRHHETDSTLFFKKIFLFQLAGGVCCYRLCDRKSWQTVYRDAPCGPGHTLPRHVMQHPAGVHPEHRLGPHGHVPEVRQGERVFGTVRSDCVPRISIRTRLILPL